MIRYSNQIEYKKDIDLYFEYSNEFFDYTFQELGLSFIKNSYIEHYAMKVIDFKRDIHNVTSKIRRDYNKNLVQEKELRNLLENHLLKL